MRHALFLAALVLGSIAHAQVSASYDLEEYAINSGGTPSGGTSPSSASYSMSLASIGDTVVAIGLVSASFQVDVGFDTAYPPPGEVTGLVLTDKVTLQWRPERAAGAYELYRDDSASAYGDCEQSPIFGTTTTDTGTPSGGAVFHYLVTVRNRLSEEGTKGFQSDTTERLGSFSLPACP